YRDLFEKLVGGSAILIHIDAQQGKTVIAILLVQIIQQRQLLAAGPAPGRPEVHHYDFAAQLGELDILSRRRCKSKVRSWPAHFLRSQHGAEHQQYHQHHVPHKTLPCYFFCTQKKPPRPKVHARFWLTCFSPKVSIS